MSTLTTCAACIAIPMSLSNSNTTYYCGRDTKTTNVFQVSDTSVLMQSKMTANSIDLKFKINFQI